LYFFIRSPQGFDLFLELHGGELAFFGLFRVVLVEFLQVGVDFFVDVLHGPLQLAIGEVAAFIVDGFELASVDSH
jgi:hypothetical protein